MQMKCDYCGKEVTGSYCHTCSRAASKSLISKRKVAGVCLIAAPWVLFLLILSAYAIVTFITQSVIDDTESLEMYMDASRTFFAPNAFASSYSSSETSLRETSGSIVGLLLGLGGMLGILGIFICTPIGLYLLLTDGKPKAK